MRMPLWSVELQKKHFYQLEMCKIFVKDLVETLKIRQKHTTTGRVLSFCLGQFLDSGIDNLWASRNAWVWYQLHALYNYHRLFEGQKIFDIFSNFSQFRGCTFWLNKMHEFICLPCACRTRWRPRPVESSTRFNPSKWAYFAPKIAITRSFIFLFIWTQKLFQSWAKILNCHSTKREILGLIFSMAAC